MSAASQRKRKASDADNNHSTTTTNNNNHNGSATPAFTPEHNSTSHSPKRSVRRRKLASGEWGDFPSLMQDYHPSGSSLSSTSFSAAAAASSSSPPSSSSAAPSHHHHALHHHHHPHHPIDLNMNVDLDLNELGSMREITGLGMDELDAMDEMDSLVEGSVAAVAAAAAVTAASSSAAGMPSAARVTGPGAVTVSVPTMPSTPIGGYGLISPLMTGVGDAMMFEMQSPASGGQSGRRFFRSSNFRLRSSSGRSDSMGFRRSSGGGKRGRRFDSMGAPMSPISPALRSQLHGSIGRRNSSGGSSMRDPLPPSMPAAVAAAAVLAATSPASSQFSSVHDSSDSSFRSRKRKASSAGTDSSVSGSMTGDTEQTTGGKPGRRNGGNHEGGDDDDDDEEDDDDDDNDDDDDDDSERANKRVRLRRPEKWKRNNYALKPLKEKGPCKCARGCFKLVLPDVRTELRRVFQLIRLKSRQDSLLLSMVKAKMVTVSKKAAEDGLGTTRRRIQYWIPTDHALVAAGDTRSMSEKQVTSLMSAPMTQRTQVCSHAFMSIFGVGKRRIESLVAHATTAGASAPRVDNRGKHRNRTNKVPEELVQLAMRHIELCSSPDGAKNDKRGKARVTIATMYRELLKQVQPVLLQIERLAPALVRNARWPKQARALTEEEVLETSMERVVLQAQKNQASVAAHRHEEHGDFSFAHGDFEQSMSAWIEGLSAYWLKSQHASAGRSYVDLVLEGRAELGHASMRDPTGAMPNEGPLDFKRRQLMYAVLAVLPCSECGATQRTGPSVRPRGTPLNTVGSAPSFLPAFWSAPHSEQQLQRLETQVHEGVGKLKKKKKGGNQVRVPKPLETNIVKLARQRHQHLLGVFCSEGCLGAFAGRVQALYDAGWQRCRDLATTKGAAAAAAAASAAAATSPTSSSSSSSGSSAAARVLAETAPAVAVRSVLHAGTEPWGAQVTAPGLLHMPGEVGPQVLLKALISRDKFDRIVRESPFQPTPPQRRVRGKS